MNTWDWHRQCEEPARLAAFVRTNPDGTTRFRADWWHEWRMQCLMQGRILAPKEVKEPK